MEPVDNPVASLISEKPAERFNPAIAFKIFIRVLRARSWVSPVNAPVNTTIIQQNYLSFSRSLLAEYRGLEFSPDHLSKAADRIHPCWITEIPIGRLQMDWINLRLISHEKHGLEKRD
jgi:hypothetical protein